MTNSPFLSSRICMWRQTYDVRASSYHLFFKTIVNTNLKNRIVFLSEPEDLAGVILKLIGVVVICLCERTWLFV